MITGAVLAGGESRRYGRNKALESFRGERLIDRGVNALRGFCDPVLVVANDLSLYLDVRATLVRDVSSRQGPLGGIYTALLFSPNEWVFVRATDMPFLEPKLPDLLLDAMSGYDAVVPMCGDLYEPLLAVYNRRCLQYAAELLERSERQIVKLYKYIRLRSVPEKEWRAVDPEGISFRNVNYPSDLDDL